MLTLYTPTLADMWFRQQMMADPETMRYNHAWGGTIPFPEDCWPSWYDCWVVHPEHQRFYRYVAERATGTFVGEIAYHWDQQREIWCANVIIHAPFRHKGYGRAALQLLCDAARDHGIAVLHDDIAHDNTAIGLFLSLGFVEKYRTDDIIMLAKTLTESPR